MANPDGTPIWYELMTGDPDAAKAFYDSAAGWTIEPQPSGAIDYRMIAAPDGNIGGVMRLDADMLAGGAQPGWLFYVGMADVDGAVTRATSLGASVMVPPTDIPDVGRFALLADPQGAPFYMMRGDSPGDSTAFAPGVRGHGSWNELSTTDATAAIAFYAALFGWENRETMDMGPLGGYHFLDHGDVRLGALVEQKGQRAHWRFYFEVDAIPAAVERITAAGGTVTQGPHEVPGGGTIVIGNDPEGATFALVAAGAAS